jgi:ubiquinone/menaquinone biosynthesis C-methylase UbiE
MTYQSAARLSTDVISYGPGAATEAEYRLLGPVGGKRILDLGCGGAQAAIALAKQGAIAIGVDISVEQLAYARRLMEDEEVRVELKHGDLAELAFQRADSVDIAFSAFALHYVPDLNRVFRQVHRVLKPQGALVFSLPHPILSITGQGTVASELKQISLEPETISVKRSYFDKDPLLNRWEHTSFTEFHRPTSEIFMGLVRSGYRIDVLMEPQSHEGDSLPQVLIMRARKEA